MADPVDLTGDITAAIEGAGERGHTIVVAHVDAQGYPAMTYRGSVVVLGPTQLGVWARDPEAGLPRSIAERPNVALLYYEPGGPGPRYLALRGKARVDRSLDDTVYDRMIAHEREVDPEKKGVAIVVDVESLMGFSDDKSRFEMG
jgi:hypothetical protein